MIRKLLCWLGWHDYTKVGICHAPDGYDCTEIKCSDCDYCLVCKYCGKVKR